MITREVFLILTIALACICQPHNDVLSVSTFHCPMACICQPFDTRYEINCSTKNDSSFVVKIEPRDFVRIECHNSMNWSDFFSILNESSVTNETENISHLRFFMCDLPTNNSLGEIAQVLGVADVERLTFQSFNNLSSALLKHHLDDFENVKTLILSSNNLSYVPKDLLSDLVNLTGLNLRENNLHLVNGFFDYTPNLQWIELGDNTLQSIEPGMFDNLKNLKFLNLWKNYLSELRPGIFDRLTALESLDLNLNYMVKLPKDIFVKLENLEKLNLSRNNFTHLPSDLLRNNKKLQSFTMIENKKNMTTLPNEFFANLTELKTLKLKKVGFVTLPEDLLWGCTSLVNITLERNYLQTLPKHIFQDLTELRILELNFNNLRELPDYIFVNTNKLAKLDLSTNQITSISMHLFEGLSALEELNIEKNQLTTISHGAFDFLKNLEIAKLSYNNLTLQDTFYEYRVFDPLGMHSPFNRCKKLKELYLANNSISKIFNDWIISDSVLRVLDLKYNNISTITTRDVQFVSSNIKVDLTHNKIEHILLREAEQFEYINNQMDAQDTIILVDNNPLHCDCDLYYFLRYIEGRMHPKVQNNFHIIPGNLTCQSPKELKNVRVIDLKSKLLTCIVSNPEVCPEKCDCLVRPEDVTFIFNCSRKNLSSVPIAIKKPKKFFQIELDFSGNQLTRMPDLKAMELGVVKKLRLSHNFISEISLDGLSSTIQSLELHNNNISRIHPDVLEFLKRSKNLTQLMLHENPWECDCDAKDFLNFIHSKFVTMNDLLKVRCSGKKIPVTEMTMVDFCPLNTTMIIGVSIAISLMGFLIGVFGLLYYKYQRQVKVWLFAHQWCLWFVTEEELDKEKLYDAFVSYSHKDQDFVVNELVSELENGPKPFKLCLHYRDWLAGEWIPANIASSVENSRRTIVVLSPNFLESVWGRMEFRAAHSQALSEGRARVILILYGDIGPTDDLDPELKAYINMNTYVKWGDPWFWDKLRYALPHQPKLARSSVTGKKIFENHQLYIQTNGDKNELIYPIEVPETPPTTTPPADALKKFINLSNDKESEGQFVNSYPQESCKLNGNIAIIFSPENLTKRDITECLV